MIVDKIKRHWWKYVLEGTAIAVLIGIITPLTDFFPLGITLAGYKISAWWLLVAGATALAVDYAMEYFQIQPR